MARIMRTFEGDCCPGLVRPYHSVDGNMVRLRLPGGFVQADQVLAVSKLAAEYANSEIQITSRNNLQVRALPEPVPAPFVRGAFATGLMPSPAHERIRTVVCSPLTSIAPVNADLSGVVRELDAAIIADPELPNLPGRFLFVLDDGSGDVLGEAFDLGYQARPDGRGVVFVGGCPDAREIDAPDAVATLIELAHRFLNVAESGEKPAWHVRELANPETLLDGIGREIDFQRPGSERPLPYGAVAGAAVVGVPLGLLTLRQAEALQRVAADCSEGQLVFTPWRGVVIPGAADRLEELAAASLMTRPESVWMTLTACYGKPCNNAQVDTRAIAEEVAAEHPAPFQRLVHISGCDRVCGEPGGEHLGLIAPADAASVLTVVDR